MYETNDTNSVHKLNIEKISQLSNESVNTVRKIINTMSAVLLQDMSDSANSEDSSDQYIPLLNLGSIKMTVSKNEDNEPYVKLLMLPNIDTENLIDKLVSGEDLLIDYISKELEERELGEFSSFMEEDE